MTTDKLSARMTAEALVAYGVTDVVVSPGSRNAPLILALEATAALTKHVVVDERSAAFVALGISLGSVADGRYKPVAVACTSGTAVLNFAPAVAEAYYRGVPLIVISADRPAEWIDQDDSQTLRQSGTLANFIKGSYNMAVANGSSGQPWLYNRTLNDALTRALGRRPGPVHINIEFDEPLVFVVSRPGEPEFSRVDTIYGCIVADPDTLSLDSYRRVMVVMGFMPPNESVSRACLQLTRQGVAVVAEAQSNLSVPASVPNADAALVLLRHRTDASDFRPDLVIAMGGAVVSRSLKTYLRRSDALEVWHVGCSDHVVDTYMHVTRRFDMCPADFLQGLAAANQTYTSTYAGLWQGLASAAAAATRRFAADAPWSDFKAMSLLMEAAAGCDLHLSNGTAVRYAQLFDYYGCMLRESNRGVSGIDGCTSTAAGASLVGRRRLLFITGDMSAQYDMAALAATEIDGRFKMVVLDNGGGGIFRFIRPLGDIDSELLEHYFCADVRLPLHQLADGFGFDYYCADCAETLRSTLPAFLDSPRKAILHIITPGATSAALYRSFYKTLRACR